MSPFLAINIFRFNTITSIYDYWISISTNEKLTSWQSKTLSQIITDNNGFDQLSELTKLYLSKFWSLASLTLWLWLNKWIKTKSKHHNFITVLNGISNLQNRHYKIKQKLAMYGTQISTGLITSIYKKYKNSLKHRFKYMTIYSKGFAMRKLKYDKYVYI